MKKILTLVAVAGMFTFVACGPSASDLAAKAKTDSIAKADSIALVSAATVASDSTCTPVALDTTKK